MYRRTLFAFEICILLIVVKLILLICFRIPFAPISLDSVVTTRSAKLSLICFSYFLIGLLFPERVRVFSHIFKYLIEFQSTFVT